MRVKKEKTKGVQWIKAEEGFSLLELIIVIAIIATLAAIAVPIFSSKGEEARISAHRTNIMQIQAAAERYEIEKTILADGAYAIGASSVIVTNGYLRLTADQSSIPNPWAGSGKDWQNYAYYIVKGKRGSNTVSTIQVYLVSGAPSVAGVKYVKIESNAANDTSTVTMSDAVAGVRTITD